MDQLHSEILLPIFTNLTSIDMVPVRAVCRKFLEIIDQNKSLWRHLVLPDSKQGGWDSKILDLWDEKSSSSLKEVSMHVKLEGEEIYSFIETLERSKETLQILSITAGHLPPQTQQSGQRWVYFEPWPSLNQLVLVLPKVVDFRVMDSKSIHSVQLIEKTQERKNTGLRVLWLKSASVVRLKMKESQLLNTLVSLKLEFDFRNCLELREILKGSSQTLKHLCVWLLKEARNVEALEFPLLECLEAYPTLSFVIGRSKFPSWIRIPSSTQVICQGIADLPSIAILWLKHVNNPLDLGFRAPRLQELKIDFRSSSLFNVLLPMLDQRQKNAEDRFEVDGVRMMPLKRLGIWFDAFSSEQIDEMRGLVEEVFDLKKASMVVEIEI